MTFQEMLEYCRIRLAEIEAVSESGSAIEALALDALDATGGRQVSGRIVDGHVLSPSGKGTGEKS